MNQNAVNWVNSVRGWSIGSAPSLVAVDKGIARSMSSETLHSGIYAFTFDQKGDGWTGYPRLEDQKA
jgi:hypothetical protein